MHHVVRFSVGLAAVAVLLYAPGVLAAGGGEESFDAHATGFHYYFQDGDMDFHFGNLVLGSAINGGVEIGEAFYAASHITDGDAASWQKQWYALAERVGSRGLESLAGGHDVSARDQFLRASYYYRISLIGVQPDDPRLPDRAAKSRDMLKKAGSMMSPRLEYFEIPFEETVLPGFFRKAESGDAPARTLIMLGGGETFAEDLYFYIADQAHERGYNFMTVDLPGQGLLPLQGKVFRPDMFVPMKAVVDYALSRKDVDPERLGVYGYSGGGGFAPQAAMHDARIKAVAMNSAVVDAFPLFSTMPAVTATEEEIDSWSSFHANVVKTICWRWGVAMDEPSALAEANKGYTFDPAKIACPALIIVGEGEYKSAEVQRQQKVALDGFAHPKSKMIVTPADEGATNHCIMENRSLMSQVLFDWMDGVFR